MGGMFEGRVTIVTGAGRGLGREHALLLASEGAAVVVNDLGGGTDGSGSDAGPAGSVVEEIVAAGGSAVANTDDVSDWEGARRLVQQAVDQFGRLDVLINNAGILRDRMLVNLSEDEWDVVMRVNAKGHAAPLRHAAAYWREQAKEHGSVSAAVVNTSSPSGLFANVGQSNYGAAKMAVAGLTMIAAKELGRYGVRVNTIAPAARTRLTAPGRHRADRYPGLRPNGSSQRRPVGRVPRVRSVHDDGAVLHRVRREGHPGRAVAGDGIDRAGG